MTCKGLPIAFCILVQLLGALALVRVISPPDIAGDYEDAPINIKPERFNVTGFLALADPPTACFTDIINVEEVTGKIVMVVTTGACTPSDQAKHVRKAGGIAMLILAEGNAGPSLGSVEVFGGKPDTDIEMPTLNFREKGGKLKQAAADKQQILVEMHDTDYNPWQEYGKTGGVALQVIFGAYAFVTLCMAAYRLYHFVRIQKIQPNLPQVCLALEIVASTLRIFWLIQPYSFYYLYLSPAGDTFLVLTPNVVSLVSTLLITFYWNELILKVSKQLNNTVLRNLDRMKAPFVVVCVVIWIMEIIADLARARAIRVAGIESTITFSAIIQLIITTLISAFFLVTGVRVVKFLNERTHSGGKTRRLHRMTKMLILCGSFMLLGDLATILYITPMNGINIHVTFFIWWLFWIGWYTVSFAKVWAFEIPKSLESSSEAHNTSSQSDQQKPTTVTTIELSNPPAAATV